MVVKVYSTESCPYCNMEKEWLKENGVEFEDINVGEDIKKAKEMIEKSGQQGVPVTIIEKDGKEEVIVGFDKDKLKENLNLNE